MAKRRSKASQATVRSRRGIAKSVPGAPKVVFKQRDIAEMLGRKPEGNAEDAAKHVAPRVNTRPTAPDFDHAARSRIGETGSQRLMLIVTQDQEKPYEFTLKTPFQFGPRTRREYDDLRTLHLDPGGSGALVSRRELYDIAPSDLADSVMKQCGMEPGRSPKGSFRSFGIDEYPTMIVLHEKSRSMFGTRPQARDDRSYDGVLAQFGSSHIWLRADGLHYKTLDHYDRTEPWSARGGFKIATGWPKALIREENGEYIDLRRYARDRGSLNDSVQGAVNAMSLSAALPKDPAILVLKYDGAGYASPRAFSIFGAEGRDEILDAAGVPRHLADRDAPPGPDILVHLGNGRFVEPERVKEPIGLMSDQHKLLNGPCGYTCLDELKRDGVQLTDVQKHALQRPALPERPERADQERRRSVSR